MELPMRWRLLAVTALVSFVGLAVLLLQLVFTNGILFVAAIAALAMVYASWLIFTGTEKRLHYGQIILIFFIMIFIASVVVFFQRGTELRDLAIIAILGYVYVASVRVLRQKFWDIKRKIAKQTETTASFRRPVLIINPKSGDGRAIKAGIDKKAWKMGTKVIIAKQGDSIEDLAREEAKRHVDVLGVSGGDGTLGAVAKVALENDLPLVVLPGGTRCHFARDAGFEPNRIVDALASFSGVEHLVDVGVINGRVFLNNVSFGLYADIIDNPRYRDHKVETSRKVLQDLLAEKQPAYSLEFNDNTGKKHSHAVQILVGVNPYETMNLFELGRRESLSTGQLQVTAVTALNDAMIRQLMSSIQIGKDVPDTLMQWNTRSFTVKSKNKQLIVGVDGEREVYDTPVKITLGTKKLRLMVPPEGMRPRSAETLNAKILGQLLRALLGQKIE